MEFEIDQERNPDSKEKQTGMDFMTSALELKDRERR
jgi:hypothetical protein